MSKGVAITGMGIISAIGNNVAENYNALLMVKKEFQEFLKLILFMKMTSWLEKLHYTNEELEQQLGLTSDNNYSRTALLGVVAAKEAIDDAGITDIKKYKTGFSFCY